MNQITESELIVACGESITANLDQICSTNWRQFFAPICVRGLHNRTDVARKTKKCQCLMEAIRHSTTTPGSPFSQVNSSSAEVKPDDLKC